MKRLLHDDESDMGPVGTGLYYLLAIILFGVVAGLATGVMADAFAFVY